MSKTRWSGLPKWDEMRGMNFCIFLVTFIAMTWWQLPLPGQPGHNPGGKDNKLTMAWGEYHIPLHLWSPPYYFRAEIELPLEEIFRLMHEPIRFFQNGKPYYLRGLLARSVLQGDPLPFGLVDSTGAFPVFDPEPDSFTGGFYRSGNPMIPAGQESVLAQQTVFFLDVPTKFALANNLKMGDKITFYTPAKKSTGIVLSSLVIKVHNPWENFRPRYRVEPMIDRGEDYSDWQVVDQSRWPSKMFRYNPQAPDIDRIKDKYATLPRYELVPIPGFRTDSRFVGDEDLVVPVGDVAAVDTLLSDPPVDPFRVGDMIVSWRMGIFLVWDSLRVDPAGLFVRREEFLAATSHPLIFEKERKPLTILQARVSVVPPQGEIRQYLIDGRQPGILADLVNRIPENVTLYWEDMIILDSDGQQRRLWVPFTLHVFGPR